MGTETQKLKTPAQKSVIGIMLSAETIDSSAGELVLISIQDIDDEIVTMSCSPAYWRKVGKLFQPDSVVKVSYEVRIGGITGYTPEGAEEMIPHKSDGQNLVSINRFSQISYQRMLDSKDMEVGVATISAVEPDRVNAVATYLSAFVRK